MSNVFMGLMIVLLFLLAVRTLWCLFSYDSGFSCHIDEDEIDDEDIN